LPDHLTIRGLLGCENHKTEIVGLSCGAGMAHEIQLKGFPFISGHHQPGENEQKLSE
jgi:hypothetical protein